MAKQIDPKSLIEDAYRRLKHLMFQQKILPGQKLLYRELSEWLHMSKTPIVNVLNRLEQEGFVVSEPNCGYSLKPMEAKEIMDSSEVREALEIKAVQQAVLSGKTGDMERLEKKLQAIEAYPPARHDKKRCVLNAEFHLQLADIGGNQVLKYLLKRNLEHIILRLNLENVIAESTPASNQEHRELLQSLRLKNLAASTHLVQKHIQQTRDLMLQFLSREALEDPETMDFFGESRRAL